MVKGKKEDKALSELFRQKLGNAEVIPSTSVSKSLMRKLARKEFLHFNPARFNIWYAGGIALAGTALVLILSSGPGNTGELKSTEISAPASKPAVIDKEARNEANKPDVAQRENLTNPLAKTLDISAKKNDEITTTGKVIIENPTKSTNVVSHTEVPSIPEGGIFSNKGAEKNKLQASVREVDNLIDASVTEGCAPLKVVFKSRSLLYDSCRWTFGDGGHSYEKNPEWLFDVEGEYEVMLQVYGRSGGQLISTALIKVHPKPLAHFEITPENAVVPDDEITFVNYSANAEKYKWDFGDGNTSELFEPKHFYSKYGNYNVRLIAYSEYGCYDSLVVQNAFGSGYFIRFPNAFIPNPNGPSGGYYSKSSDEYAYVFHPAHSGVSSYQLRIFSRRGLLVFESNDVSIGWDGYYKGQLCDPGVYVWKVRGNYINGEPFTLMGDVTLLKN
jgi:PKD repeat protein